jgi:hypothetical protein
MMVPHICPLLADVGLSGPCDNISPVPYLLALFGERVGLFLSIEVGTRELKTENRELGTENFRLTPLPSS